MKPAEFSKLLITGATGALGRALVEEARAAGLSTAVLARRPVTEADWSAITSLTTSSDLHHALTRMEAEWGLPDAVILATGASRAQLFARQSDCEQEDLLQANLLAILAVARAVIPLLMQVGGGSIVLIGSLAALRPRPGQAVYAACKGALESLARALARELAPKSIRVNTLAPGFLDTPMVQQLTAREQSSLMETIPMHRLGKVHEVARAALFLASPDAGYITGQTIRMDGGASC